MLIPNELLRYTDRFDDPKLPGVIDVTIKIIAVSCGSDLSIQQSGIPESMPMEMCYLGWQQSLALLTKLVEQDAHG